MEAGHCQVPMVQREQLMSGVRISFLIPDMPT